MLLCRRVLAALTSFLSVAGLLVSVALGIGVWFVAEAVTARVSRVFARIEVGLDIAEKGLARVRTSLDRATERLDSARQDHKKLNEQPQPKNAVRKVLAQTLQQSLAPNIGDATKKLHTVAEAVVVVNSVLDDVGNIPFLSESGFDLDSLGDLNSRLADVGPAAWELSRLLGEPDSDAVIDAQFTRVDQALQAIRDRLDEYEPKVKEVRQRTEHLKERTLGWITVGTVLTTVICFWIALSQLSLLSHARSWGKTGPNQIGK